MMIPLLLALASGTVPRPCLAFLPSDTKEIAYCVSTDAQGAMVVGASARKHLAFERGLASISVDGEFYYVDRRGKTRSRAARSTTARTRSSKGSPRTIVGGKVGFLDRKLRRVIAPQWDFAFPFRGGRAVVCNGCRAVPGDEHHRITGGLWGSIDRRGRTVVPVAVSRRPAALAGWVMLRTRGEP